MKRVVLSFVLVLILGLTAKGADTVLITMTSNKSGVVKFSLQGSGTVMIDWGNGKIITRKITASVRFFSLYYFKNSKRTITVYGQNVTRLICKSNQITSLDVSHNTTLKSLQCSKNQLTNLDVSKNTALKYLDCGKNQIENLDVSTNKALINLVSNENQLTCLNVSKNPALMFLNIRKNQISAEALNGIFDTLNGVIEEGKILYILDNPGTKTCDQKIATDKEWKIDTSFI